MSIEQTIEFHVAGRTIRLWLKEESINPLPYPVEHLKQTALDNMSDRVGELAEKLIKEIPNLNAIQVQGDNGYGVKIVI